MRISLSGRVEQYVSVIPSNWIILEGYDGDKLISKWLSPPLRRNPSNNWKHLDIGDKIK
jgi:hypothetical protein